MDTSTVREIYNKKVVSEYGGDYENKRWFGDEIARSAYEMTAMSIKEHIIEAGLNFSNFFEVGPGEGTWTKMFLETSKAAMFDLIDISSEMLAGAKIKLGRYQNIRYFESDFLAFEPDKKYDLFFSCRALEYSPDKESFVKKVAFLLNDGGRGFVITKTPKYWRAKLLGRKISELHRGQISPRLLKNLLERYGFKNVEIYPVTMNFPLLNLVNLNLLLHKIFFRRKLNFLSQFFAESYLVKFSKL